MICGATSLPSFGNRRPRSLRPKSCSISLPSRSSWSATAIRIGLFVPMSKARLRSFASLARHRASSPLSSSRPTRCMTHDSPHPFSEQSFLGGLDPYAASKAAAELVVGAWPSSATRLGTARAGNVIGGGDWSRDRLLPDLVRAWSADEPLVLRNPAGVRPWQHVLEPLRGYLVFAESLARNRQVSGPTTSVRLKSTPRSAGHRRICGKGLDRARRQPPDESMDGHE